MEGSLLSLLGWSLGIASLWTLVVFCLGLAAGYVLARNTQGVAVIAQPNKPKFRDSVKDEGPDVYTLAERGELESYEQGKTR